MTEHGSDVGAAAGAAAAGPGDLPGWDRGLRVTVYLGETDHSGHHPLFTEIVRLAHDAGLRGATVLRGIEGFGSGGVLHTARMLSLTESLPVLVVAVDRARVVEAFLPRLTELLDAAGSDATVAVDEVSLRRRGTHDRGPGHPDGSAGPAGAAGEDPGAA